MRDVIAMVLAGGKGERLYPLTQERPKPCVPFGGTYKIVDFALSNLFNSEIRKIYVLSQYCGYMMTRHIRDSWSHWTGRDEFVAAVSPTTNANGGDWFLGTADAIYQYLHFFEGSDAEQVAILCGDHIYKMDFRAMVRAHRESKADLTIAATEVHPDEASRFGIIEAEADGRIVGFDEKPEKPKMAPGKDSCYASMGIYIFDKKRLVENLQLGKELYEELDFGKHIIPQMLANSERVFAYNFNEATVPEMTPSEIGYWRDVGTLDSYFEASMDLISISPRLNLYSYKWPILANHQNLPPAKTVFDQDGRRGNCIESYVSHGCIISGGTVRRCILSPLVRVHSHSYCEDSIIFDGATIGRGARLRRVIVDKRVEIPPSAEIGYNHDDDRARGYTVTPGGIVVVPWRPEGVR